MNFTASVIKHCLFFGVPACLENPSTSLAWQYPCIVDITTRGEKVVLDQCAFGTSWRRRTTLCVWCCGSAAHLGMRCQGRKGTCSFSRMRHIVLQGRCPHSNVLWTKVAQAYPVKLCRAIANLLQSSWEHNHLRNVSQVVFGV